MTIYSHAQVRLGVYVGSVTNDFKGDNVASLYGVYFNANTAFSTGVLIDIPIKKDVLISFQPGFKTLGGIAKMSEEDVYGTIPEQPIEPTEPVDPEPPVFIKILEIKLKYLNLPVLLKIISDNERWQFIGGIEAAWAYNANMNLLLTGESRNINNAIRNINLSTMVGFGYLFKVKKTRFSIDLLYSQSVINISKIIPDRFDSVPRVKSTAAETRFTWYLPSFNK